jgi:hypothetical protein
MMTSFNRGKGVPGIRLIADGWVDRLSHDSNHVEMLSPNKKIYSKLCIIHTYRSTYSYYCTSYCMLSQITHILNSLSTGSNMITVENSTSHCSYCMSATPLTRLLALVTAAASFPL